MKKCIYFLILSCLWFSHLNTQAGLCEKGFQKLIAILKKNTERQNEKSRLASSRQPVQETLLKELSNPELSIQSIARPIQGQYYGEGFIPPVTHLSPKERKGHVVYSSFYIPKQRLPVKQKTGEFFLLLTIYLGERGNETYQHWIHWPSKAKKIHLSENTVREIFNEVYKSAYGRNLDWMLENDVLSKTIERIVIENRVNQFEAYDILNMSSLLFRAEAQKLKDIITKVLESPQSAPQEKTQPTQEQTPSLLLSDQMSAGMRRIILRTYPIEILKRLDPIEIKTLRLSDIVELFNTREKIRIVDMSLLLPEVTVNLLTEHQLWRESVTPNQIKQLDTSAAGIQYVLVPTFKHYVWRPGEETKKISIDTLSDAQIAALNRDTFLRDVFLAGEIYAEGILPVEVINFKMQRKKEVYILGLDTVIDKSLPKEMHDFIVKKLGFDVPFESMTVEQKRELFKKEVDMMTNSKLQARILEEVIQENKQSNHNWFSTPNQL